tara:strand:- start:363 stop:542 length:180 start_codon:yes stop_codon:yes gene_type:complete
MAQSTEGVGVKSGLSEQKRIDDSLKELGLASKGPNQRPEGVGTGSSAPHGTRLDGGPNS